jgi:Tfp pilus assembly protein PilX
MAKGEKGVALFLILSLLMVAAVLAGVIMNITLSHFELTRHKVQRVKAYYAALAGMNLAFEQLRTGAWSGNNTYTLCSSGCTVNDADIPYTVTINITKTDSVNNTVNISVNYTSTLPTFRGK